jgi:cysteinyl-tRNA synthetase
MAGLKMSKSLKNFVTIRDLLEQGHDPDDFRVFCLQHAYWKNVQFRWAISAPSLPWQAHMGTDGGSDV